MLIQINFNIAIIYKRRNCVDKSTLQNLNYIFVYYYLDVVSTHLEPLV